MGLGFLASVFDMGRLEWLEDIGVKRYKIASRSVKDEELCKAIISKGKPVLVSDGHVEYPDWLYLGTNIAWLYCISDYPTPLKKINFNLQGWNYFFPAPYLGFSDHTIGISAAVTAMSLGARIIEKHFTLDSGLPGPDQICSINPEELKQLCGFRDDIEKILYKD